MDELNEIKHRDYGTSTKTTRWEWPLADEIEELEADSDSEADSGSEPDETPEPYEGDTEDLSLTRWPSHPPTTISLVRGGELKSQLRFSDTIRIPQRPRYRPALECIVEDNTVPEGESKVDEREVANLLHKVSHIAESIPVESALHGVDLQSEASIVHHDEKLVTTSDLKLAQPVPEQKASVMVAAC